MQADLIEGPDMHEDLFASWAIWSRWLPDVEGCTHGDVKQWKGHIQGTCNVARYRHDWFTNWVAEHPQARKHCEALYKRTTGPQKQVETAAWKRWQKGVITTPTEMAEHRRTLPSIFVYRQKKKGPKTRSRAKSNTFSVKTFLQAVPVKVLIPQDFAWTKFTVTFFSCFFFF